MKRVLRVLEYSADSAEAIEHILKYRLLASGRLVENSYIINGVIPGMEGGKIIATCNVMDIPFVNGKYRLIRMLDYVSIGGTDRGGYSITGTQVIAKTLSTSNIPTSGEKTITQNGFEVVIRSGIIGYGFGEDINEGL